MASLQGLVDYDAEPSTGEFEPVPEGVYELEIIDADVKSTKNGNGQVLHLINQIASGEYANRTIWAYINIQNSNETAQSIGQREFAALRKAIGVNNVNDTEDLLHKLYHGVVGVEERRDKPGTFSNRIKQYLFDGGPEPKVGGTQAKAANDNARPAPSPANDNNSYAAAKIRPWGGAKR